MASLSCGYHWCKIVLVSFKSAGGMLLTISSSEADKNAYESIKHNLNDECLLKAVSVMNFSDNCIISDRFQQRLSAKALMRK